MAASLPKQFLMLQGHPVLWYTVETFLNAYADLQVVLVVPVGYEEDAKRAIGFQAAGGRIVMVTGGDTRFHSVRNGLAKIKDEAGPETIVFVHDAVRCLVSADLIRRCYSQAADLGSAVPVVDCRDSVRLVDDEGHSKPIDRSRIKMVQTPQTFRGDILLGAYSLDHQEAFTDEATVVEIAGQEVHLIEGEQSNIKITTPEDMIYAEQLLKGRK